MLNSNIPFFKCLVKQSYFTKDEKDSNIFHDCYAFAVQSITGKILTFHIMTDYGMLRSRVPISEIYMKELKEIKHPSTTKYFDMKIEACIAFAKL